MLLLKSRTVVTLVTAAALGLALTFGTSPEARRAAGQAWMKTEVSLELALERMGHALVSLGNGFSVRDDTSIGVEIGGETEPGPGDSSTK